MGESTHLSSHCAFLRIMVSAEHGDSQTAFAIAHHHLLRLSLCISHPLQTLCPERPRSPPTTFAWFFCFSKHRWAGDAAAGITNCKAHQVRLYGPPLRSCPRARGGLHLNKQYPILPPPSLPPARSQHTQCIIVRTRRCIYSHSPAAAVGTAGRDLPMYEHIWGSSERHETPIAPEVLEWCSSHLSTALASGKCSNGFRLP